MLASMLHSPRDVRCEEVAEPEILKPTDASAVTLLRLMAARAPP